MDGKRITEKWDHKKIEDRNQKDTKQMAKGKGKSRRKDYSKVIRFLSDSIIFLK